MTTDDPFTKEPNMTRARHITPQILAALALTAFSSAAVADYQCSAKEFEATLTQKELYSRAALAMRTAFLLPPDGWVMSVPNTRVPGGKFCGDFKNDPVTFGASVRYALKPSADELRRYRAAGDAQRAESVALKTLPPELQTRVDALEAQISAVRKEAREADRAKNRELSKAKYDEGTELGRQIYKLRDEHTTKIRPQEMAIYKKYEKDLTLNRDRSTSVSIEANTQPMTSDARPERVVIGSATAKTNQATDKLVRIVVSVDRSTEFPPEHVATLKKLVDVAKLQAMMAGNMPTIEESRVAITQQNDAIAQSTAKAREVERMVDNEGRRAEEAAHIAKRQADAEKAKAVKADEPDKAKTAKLDEAKADKVDAPKPAPTVAAEAPKAPTPAAPDTVKDAKDAVNKLRGLFGR